MKVGGNIPFPTREDIQMKRKMLIAALVAGLFVASNVAQAQELRYSYGSVSSELFTGGGQYGPGAVSTFIDSVGRTSANSPTHQTTTNVNSDVGGSARSEIEGGFGNFSGNVRINASSDRFEFDGRRDSYNSSDVRVNTSASAGNGGSSNSNGGASVRFSGSEFPSQPEKGIVEKR